MVLDTKKKDKEATNSLKHERQGMNLMKRTPDSNTFRVECIVTRKGVKVSMR